MEVKINLPYIGKIKGIWEPSEIEKEASWEIYILLITQISFIKKTPEYVLIKESIFILHSITITINAILCKYGLALHQPKNEKLTLGYITILILNYGIRPVIERWYPFLLMYDKKYFNKNPDYNLKIPKIVDDLNNMSDVINNYINILAKAVDVPSVFTTNFLD